MTLNIQSLWKPIRKLIVTATFLVTYMYLAIPVRTEIANSLKSYVKENKSEDVIVISELARSIVLGEKYSFYEYRIRIPFSKNFVFGVIGLIFLSAEKRFFFAEAITQLVCGMIIFTTAVIGISNATYFLIISDLFSVYFLPLSSLLMVVLAFREKKSHLTKLIDEE